MNIEGKKVKKIKVNVDHLRHAQLECSDPTRFVIRLFIMKSVFVEFGFGILGVGFRVGSVGSVVGEFVVRFVLFKSMLILTFVVTLGTAVEFLSQCPSEHSNSVSVTLEYVSVIFFLQRV